MKDWADLPPELIHLISNKLPDVTDFIRFRAVCKRWQSSAPLSDPPPQLPWLLECTPRRTPNSWLDEELRFYSLSTGETGTLPVKESHDGMSYQGPCNGYLFLVWISEYRISLWNPLTNADISIPWIEHCVLNLWPVWTGSDPIFSRNIIVVDKDPDRYPNNEIGRWAVYHPSSREWSTMKGYFYNGCYWDGVFFTTRGHITKAFSGTSQKLLYEIPSPEYIFDLWLPDDTDVNWPRKYRANRPQYYLVELSGVIMRVCMYRDRNKNVEESIFEFYELHFERRDQKPSWVKVSDIGNHIMFLDLRHGFSMKPIAGLKGNCIYFLSLDGSTPCRYDIATGTFQRLPCPFEACTWFLPSLC